MLSKLKTSSKVTGVKQSLKAIRAENASCVYFAENADPALLSTLREECAAHGVEMIAVESMDALGQACEIEVGAAVAALLKDGCKTK